MIIDRPATRLRNLRLHDSVLLWLRMEPKYGSGWVELAFRRKDVRAPDGDVLTRVSLDCSELSMDFKMERASEHGIPVDSVEIEEVDLDADGSGPARVQLNFPDAVGCIRFCCDGPGIELLRDNRLGVRIAAHLEGDNFVALEQLCDALGPEYWERKWECRVSDGFRNAYPEAFPAGENPRMSARDFLDYANELPWPPDAEYVGWREGAAQDLLIIRSIDSIWWEVFGSPEVRARLAATFSDATLVFRADVHEE